MTTLAAQQAACKIMPGHTFEDVLASLKAARSDRQWLPLGAGAIQTHSWHCR